MLKWIVAAGAVIMLGCAQSLVTQGRKMADEGNYDRAIELLYQEIESRPDGHAAWLELGATFYKKGDYTKAEDALKRADRADPRTHLYLGLVLEALGKIDPAIVSYRVALGLNPPGDTKELVRLHLDQLVKSHVAEQVSSALANEAAIDVGTIAENTVAVTDFDGSHLSSDMAPIALGLAELTVADLARVGSIRLVERLKIEVLMTELNMGQGDQLDAANAPRLGRLLGSAKIVTGTVMSIGDDGIRLDGTVIDTRDSTSRSAEPTEGKLAKFFDVQKDMVLKVIADLDITLTAEERDAIREVPTESYLAFMAYCRGLDYDRRGMAGAAQTEFRAALEHDQSFAAADTELQSSLGAHQPKVTTSQLETAVDEMSSTAGLDPNRAANLAQMAASSDNERSVPRQVPAGPWLPAPAGVGTVNITGDIDAD